MTIGFEHRCEYRICSGYAYRICILDMHIGYAYRIYTSCMHIRSECWICIRYAYRICILDMHIGYACQIRCISNMHIRYADRRCIHRICRSRMHIRCAYRICVSDMRIADVYAHAHRIYASDSHMQIVHVFVTTSVRLKMREQEHGAVPIATLSRRYCTVPATNRAETPSNRT